MRIISIETLTDVDYEKHYLCYRPYRNKSGEEKHALIAKSVYGPSGESVLASRNSRKEIEQIILKIGSSFTQGKAVHIIEN